MVLPLQIVTAGLAVDKVANTAVTKEKPTNTGKEGDTKQTTGKNAVGGEVSVYWKWDGKDWVEISETTYRNLNDNTNYTPRNQEPEAESISTAVRYPRNMSIGEDSDYVLFEFYEYQPPYNGTDAGIRKNAGEMLNDFARLVVPGLAPIQDLINVVGNVTNTIEQESFSGRALAVYNQSNDDDNFYKKTSRSSVIMYMPQDLSTGYRAQWTGKKFSNLGANMLKTIGSKNPLEGLESAANSARDAVNNLIPQATNKAIQETIGRITGDSLSADDIFGSTRGVILNPNVELLFGGHDLRNFTLTYKLVPRNEDEAKDIKKIINTFRAAMLPNFADGDELTFSRAISTASNFIKVPNVCKLSFMRGGGLNPDVPQYKMCAMTQVDINYTPDGTYATYSDGTMVAYELTLSFQETKLIFSEEVEKY